MGRLFGKLRKALSLQHTMPCVGLVVLAGSLTLVIAPDNAPTIESQRLAEENPDRFTVVIDAGHGGRDNGAKMNGLVERELTLDLAVRIEKLLQTFGFPTVLTRRDDSSLSLAQRTSIANETANAIVVSLHFNHDTSGAGGVETFYAKEKRAPEEAWSWIGFFNTPDPGDDMGEALAGYVQSSLASRLEARNRGIKPRDFYMLRHTRAPAVLIEGGFLSNAFEARLLANPEYRQRMAVAIVDGIMAYQQAEGARKSSTPLVQFSR